MTAAEAEAVQGKRAHFSNLQNLHFGQTPESPISQFADVVALEFQDFQAVQPLERQPFNQADAISVQLPEITKAKQVY